ncbi:hypothetical protein ANANG_G00139010 [Anguilla anguilla]|uniref:Uncharacterized protein n=1 Tax=Anguilla anguilla TaxID=7936 RepID=A0A9D3MAE6_ANGAN|nr:hypothetical protein ANANG_G00139010 [Anguilla anguilla]
MCGPEFPVSPHVRALNFSVSPHVRALNFSVSPHVRALNFSVSPHVRALNFSVSPHVRALSFPCVARCAGPEFPVSPDVRVLSFPVSPDVRVLSFPVSPDVRALSFPRVARVLSSPESPRVARVLPSPESPRVARVLPSPESPRVARVLPSPVSPVARVLPSPVSPVPEFCPESPVFCFPVPALQFTPSQGRPPGTSGAVPWGYCQGSVVFCCFPLVVLRWAARWRHLGLCSVNCFIVFYYPIISCVVSRVPLPLCGLIVHRALLCLVCVSLFKSPSPQTQALEPLVWFVCLATCLYLFLPDSCLPVVCLPVPYLPSFSSFLGFCIFVLFF